MRTVVFLDLDDTFWDFGVVPRSAIAAIRAARANGHMVFTNTGRTRGETRDLTRYGLDGRCYGQGSEVFIGDERVVDAPLGAETARLLEDHLAHLRLSYLAEGSERCYKHFFDEGHHRELMAFAAPAHAAGDPFLHCSEVSEMGASDYEQVYKYSIFCREPTTAATVPDLPQGFRFTPLGTGGEITRATHTKATAMEAVRSRLPGEWRTMALGDGNNDIPMLRAADVGVCMGNGNDEAKDSADWVTRAISDDGLAHAFEHFGLV